MVQHFDPYPFAKILNQYPEKSVEVWWRELREEFSVTFRANPRLSFPLIGGLDWSWSTLGLGGKNLSILAVKWIWNSTTKPQQAKIGKKKHVSQRPPSGLVAEGYFFLFQSPSHQLLAT